MYFLHNQVTMSYNFVEELKNTSVSSQKTMQETNIKKHFFWPVNILKIVKI